MCHLVVEMIFMTIIANNVNLSLKKIPKENVKISILSRFYD